jgi:Carboxypeptidase regulatory-like domain
VLNQDTGISRAIQTDANGYYYAPSLSLGDCRVRGEREGFQTEVRDGIVLTAGRQGVADLAPTVGAVTQRVAVTAGLL